MRVNVEPDCGNAPKKEFVRDWLIAMANGDAAVMEAAMDEDVQWEIVGESTRSGVGAVVDAAVCVAERAPSVFTIRHLLSHGKQVAAEGSVGYPDGERHRFAHIVTFSGHGKSARISEIVTYRLPEPLV